MKGASQAVPVSTGPFRGMRYVSDPAEVDRDFAYYALNMLPADRSRPSGYMRYFAYQVTDTTIAAAVQGYEPFQALEEAVAVIGGQLYLTKNWSAVPWVATAALTGAGITLSAIANVYMCEFNGQLIVSDGVNTPFAVSTVAGLTKLTNAPVFFGQPTVYYGKVFAIKATDRKSIVWSEENQPNTGYEAGGFNNAWTLTQGGPGDLYALRGTNAGLYYWRAEACGVIRGAVTPDFSAAGTHDDVSRQVGSVSSRTLLVEQDIWFIDQFARPQRIVGGVLQARSPASQILDAFTDTTAPSTPLGFPAASRDTLESRLGYDKRFGLVVCLLQDTLARSRFFVFASDTGQALCEHTPDPGLVGPTTWHLAPVGSGTGFATQLALVGRGVAGNVFLYRPPGPGGQYYAPSGSNHQPTAWYIITAPLGTAPGVDSTALRVQAELDVQGTDAGAAVLATTNSTTQMGQLLTIGSSLGSRTVGAQATRRSYRIEWGLCRVNRFHQYKISGTDQMYYWAVERVTADLVPEPAGALVT